MHGNTDRCMFVSETVTQVNDYCIVLHCIVICSSLRSDSNPDIENMWTSQGLQLLITVAACKILEKKLILSRRRDKTSSRTGIHFRDRNGICKLRLYMLHSIYFGILSHSSECYEYV